MGRAIPKPPLSYLDAAREPRVPAGIAGSISNRSVAKKGPVPVPPPHRKGKENAGLRRF